MAFFEASRAHKRVISCLHFSAALALFGHLRLIQVWVPAHANGTWNLNFITYLPYGYDRSSADMMKESGLETRRDAQLLRPTLGLCTLDFYLRRRLDAKPSKLLSFPFATG